MKKYDTGKVVIGSHYKAPKPPMSADEEAIQSAYIDKPLMDSEDIADLIFSAAKWFFGFLAVCIFAGMLYAIITKSPNKPVPDCGSCRIYKEKTK